MKTLTIAQIATYLGIGYKGARSAMEKGSIPNHREERLAPDGITRHYRVAYEADVAHYDATRKPYNGTACDYKRVPATVRCIVECVDEDCPRLAGHKWRIPGEGCSTCGNKVVEPLDLIPSSMPAIRESSEGGL